MCYLPTSPPPSQKSSNRLKLCMPTSHDELILLYFWISAKQICCGLTECRLSRGVPTSPRGANTSRKGASLATHLFLIMSYLPIALPPAQKIVFNFAETWHADWAWWVITIVFPNFRETRVLWVYREPTRPRGALQLRRALYPRGALPPHDRVEWMSKKIYKFLQFR